MPPLLLPRFVLRLINLLFVNQIPFLNSFVLFVTRVPLLALTISAIKRSLGPMIFSLLGCIKMVENLRFLNI